MKKARVIFALIFSFTLSACQLGTPVPIATTLPPKQTLTPVSTATITPSPTNTPHPSATPNVTATKQVDNMIARVQEYYNEGQLSTTDGEFFKMDDFQFEVAMMNYIRRFPTGFTAKNFVFRADFEWSSDTLTSGLSGCGVAFREDLDGNHYMVSVTNKRIMNFSLLTNLANYYRPIGSARGNNVVKFSSPAKINFTLVVNENHASIYIDNNFKLELALYPNKLLDKGLFSFAVFSGTNRGYGTRCSITNAELWKSELIFDSSNIP